MIVVDASAMAEILLASGLGKRVAERTLAAKRRHAPHLLDVEVISTLRRFVSSGQMKAARAQQAIDTLRIFPLRRHPHALLDRVFELRANLTACDALYLALAEVLGATLVTCDAALAGVPGRCAAVEPFV